MENRQSTSVMEFDNKRPWGNHILEKPLRRRLGLCQRVSYWKGFGRLAFWLRHPLKHRLDGPVDTEIWGLNMRLMPRGNLSESRMLFLPGWFDRRERQFMREHLKPGAVFFDIGANAGAYSFWAFSCLKTECSIYSVEPDPELQKRIEFNAATNGASSLKIIPDALSDETGEMKLVFGKGNRGQNSLEERSSESGAISVRVRTLDALVRDLGLSKIDAMKIDIEGHEFRVMGHYFAHADKALWPKWIICETCTKQQAEGMGDLLDSVGYKRVCKGRMNDIFEFATS